MQINGSVINGEAINGPGTLETFSAEGSGVLIEISQSVELSAAGDALIEISQLIGKQGSGALIQFAQTIALHETGSGTLIEIEQTLNATASGALIQIEQKIKPTTPAFDPVAQFGWDAELYVGGVEMTQYVWGVITVTRSENSAALMDVTLLPPAGVQDIESYHGKRVVLNVETASGLHRLYTGIVDIPEIDILGKRITLRCTDRRTELINAQLADQLPYIGSYSDAIFEEPDDVAEELAQRLLTTPKAVDFDAYGNAHIASYFPKASPDFTLSGSVIYRRRPQVKITSRGRIVNLVNVSLETRYVRLRHREKSFVLEGPSFCDVMNTRGLAFMSVDGARSNVESSGWILKPNSIDFTYLPDAGVYNCGNGKFIWNPTVVTGGTTRVKRDENCDPILDANGNPVYERVGTVFTNYQNQFAIDCSWTAAKRWAQDITENISITVSAPQSINQFGVVEENQSSGYDIEYDSTDFEQLEDYQSPSGMVDGGSGDYYLDKTGSSVKYKNFIDCAVDMAITKIRKSHRDNEVTAQVFLWPELDLRHTVRCEAPQLEAQGKTTEIVHVLNIRTRAAETEFSIGLSRARGTQADGSLTIPILNASLLSNVPNGSYTMKTFDDNSGTGFNLGNDSNPVTTAGIVTPEIEAIARDRQTVSSSYSLNIGLQNDDLEVTF